MKKLAAAKQPGEAGTTGHVWDGIEELNNPLPRWWVWTPYATIVRAVICTVLYPAWPLVSRATSGILGYSTRAQVAEAIAAVDTRNADLIGADLTRLDQNQALHDFAVNAGAAIFSSNCSQCHGSGAAGLQTAGYPNLLDDYWLWGGADRRHRLYRDPWDPQRTDTRQPLDPDARLWRHAGRS